MICFLFYVGCLGWGVGKKLVDMVIFFVFEFILILDDLIDVMVL